MQMLKAPFGITVHSNAQSCAFADYGKRQT